MLYIRWFIIALLYNSLYIWYIILLIIYYSLYIDYFILYLLYNCNFIYVWYILSDLYLLTYIIINVQFCTYVDHCAPMINIFMVLYFMWNFIQLYQFTAWSWRACNFVYLIIQMVLSNTVVGFMVGRLKFDGHIMAWWLFWSIMLLVVISCYWFSY